MQVETGVYSSVRIVKNPVDFRVSGRGCGSLKVLASLEEEDQFSGVKSAAALCCLCKDTDDARSS